MKILHIFSNWKWTGPAEHALNLALTLKKSGHSVTFACAPPPEGILESIVSYAKQAGIEPLTCFNLNKHFNILNNLKDISALRRFIKAEKFDLVHTHLPNDHLIIGMALRTTYWKTPIIRTCYDGDRLQSGLRTPFFLYLMTDGLITISERTRNLAIKKYSFLKNKIWKVDIPVNLQRFDPSRVNNNRDKYNLSKNTAVGGIVARVQKHRHFEVLLEALHIVINEFSGFRFMIIGRGTHIKEIAVKPSQKLGIRSNLIFTGYKNEDFLETLACLNFKIFLVPGSDGSCRAVREAMAMGIPVIAADRGMLSEIIEHGKDGVLIDDTPENLARAILFLIEHPDQRKKMGLNAFNKSRERFDLNLQTKKVEEIYNIVLSRKSTKKINPL